MARQPQDDQSAWGDANAMVQEHRLEHQRLLERDQVLPRHHNALTRELYDAEVRTVEPAIETSLPDRADKRRGFTKDRVHDRLRTHYR